MLKGLNLAKIYKIGSKTISPISNATFDLKKGDFVFLVGKSGAGKSTLLRMIFLEERPDRGKLFFNEMDITNLKEKLVQMYRQHIGVIFQDYKLLENKTARENITFVLEILNKPRKEIHKITDYLLDLVELSDRADLYPSQLSGGEKRRIAIARAVANRPKVVLADEPTGDLDEENSVLIMQILQRINERGTSIIMATHRLDIIKLFEYPIWKLHDGILETEVDREDIDSLYNTSAPQFHDKKLLWLTKHIPANIYSKLEKIKPQTLHDILSLTPKQLKEQLDFTGPEMKTLKEVLTKLDVIN